jgi:hypothetical protein
MKTSELTGAQLDWAVAQCEAEHSVAATYDDWTQTWPFYSINWEQGGPIIERERIAVEFLQWDDIDCTLPIWTSYKFFTDYEGQGPTPLIAAMRCYVASKLGDEVDIPKELS